MVELPADQHDLLRASVFSVLQSVLDLGSLRDVITSVRTVVDTAIADIAHAWNTAHKDPLCRLPVELHVSCLQWLELGGIITASQVSRAWRTIALSEPSLWDSFDASSFENFERAFEVVLLRSQATPFDITWDTKVEPSQRVREMLVAHASHLRKLHLPSCRWSDELLSVLLSTSLPHLRTLQAKYENTRARLRLPDMMSDETMPKLQSVTLGPVLLPTRIHAVSSVTFLHLGAPSDCRDLFELFPLVQQVTLRDVSSATLLPYRLARSVTSMRLFSPAPLRIHEDHSVHLQSLDWHLVPHMRLECPDILEPLAWFSARTNSGWGMIINCEYYQFGRFDVTLKAEDGTALLVSVSSTCISPYTISIHPERWTADLTTLTLDGIVTSLTVLARKTIPSLRYLTLRPSRDHEARWMSALPSQQPAFQPVVVPVLRHLVLDFAVSRLHMAAATQVLQAVPTIVSLGDRRLDTIHLVARGIAQLQRDDMPFVAEFCDELRLENVEFVESRVFHSDQV
ncbi:hypothetical protein EXIGLDRAFT_735491 [Exidia glandulosa HHB12029]|uniref:F-box domain-containing protein n=1 Tax=Exidia glandulosa HHB12029 TaxID=1314781 RepID=A0A166NI97_EXIGL|nr:hypothetical protein EXIGLDRAFT_735491 [Exidia glandulosa HHB12029]